MLGDTVADIWIRREEREQRQREEKAQKQRRERVEVIWDKPIHSTEEEVTEKHVRTDRSDTERNTEAGGEGGDISIAFQAQEGEYDEHLLDRLR